MRRTTYDRLKAQGLCPGCRNALDQWQDAGHVYCRACRLAMMVQRPDEQPVYPPPPVEPVYTLEHPHPATRWWFCLRCHRPLLDDTEHVCTDH